MSVAESTDVTFGGTFTLPSLCRPWKVCSNDETRPALCHPYVYRREDDLWLCATDTYVAVAVKVSEGDGARVRDGFVPRQVAKLIRRGHKAEQLSETAWTVVVSPYHEATYDLAGLLGSKPTPISEKLESVDLWGDTPVASTEGFGERIKFGFNPTLTENIHQALGGQGGLRATVVGPLAAIRYEARYSTGVGLQMPIRLDDAA
jgi:hypothetical protein